MLVDGSWSSASCGPLQDCNGQVIHLQSPRPVPSALLLLLALLVALALLLALLLVLGCWLYCLPCFLPLALYCLLKY